MDAKELAELRADADRVIAHYHRAYDADVGACSHIWDNRDFCRLCKMSQLEAGTFRLARAFLTAAPPPLVWSDAKPTEEGRWWHRDTPDTKPEDWVTVKVIGDNTIIDEDGFDYHFGEFDGQFAGPILQPQEPPHATR